MKFRTLLLLAAAFLTFSGPPAQADSVPIRTRTAPPLASVAWRNGSPTTLAAQRGNVVVLLFWTRDCINCKHNLGYWNEWAKKYAGTDVTVLSVHTPETPSERSPEATARFAQTHGLKFPIAIDNDEKIWNAYGVESWPTEILIDRQGRLRAEYAGELNWGNSGEYKAVARRIEALRAEPA